MVIKLPLRISYLPLRVVSTFLLDFPRRDSISVRQSVPSSSGLFSSGDLQVSVANQTVSSSGGVELPFSVLPPNRGFFLFI